MRLVAALFLFAVACKNDPDPRTAGDAPEDDGGPAEGGNDPGPGGPKIDSEIGALDEKAVGETFRVVRPKVTKCLRSANDGLDMKVVGGELEVQIRVKSDGSVRWVVPLRSTLGDLDAERCILEVLSDQTWPKPEGGDEGLATTDYGIDPPGREPVEWSPGDLGDKEAAVTSALSKCSSEAGAASVSVTLYVDADGKVITAGGAVGDENGAEAVACAVAAVKAMTFPSPGSYPAKVTVTVR